MLVKQGKWEVVMTILESSGMTILKEFILDGKKNRPGTKIVPKSVTIHNTDNSDAGAGAKAHSGFVRNTGYYMLNGEKNWVSWHFTVDDTHVIQHLPLDEKAFHAGGSANGSSIAIEICMNSDNDETKANRNAARLVADLLQQFDFTLADIKKHKDWTGKNCPSQLMTTAKWNAFKKQVENALSSSASLEAAWEAPDNAQPDDVELDHEALAVAIRASSLQPLDFSADIDSRLENVVRRVPGAAMPGGHDHGIEAASDEDDDDGTTGSMLESVGSLEAASATLRYINQSRTRNRKCTANIERKLVSAVAEVYGPSHTVSIYSGGQDRLGHGPRRTGSIRHDDYGAGGRAADVFVNGPDGRMVAGLALAKLGQFWLARGYGGVGHEMKGDGQGGGIHLDEWTTPPPGGGMFWTYPYSQGKPWGAEARRMLERGSRGIYP